MHPDICPNLNTDHQALIGLYRKARAVPGVKKVLVASGVRYDLAATSPEYVRELATHHVGGYLKIAPEHTEDGPLAMMLKPGIGAYEKFRALFDRYSREAGKKQYLIPYFIAAHPGTTDQDMVALALWLKRNGFRADQVQAFLPSPMATATAMYHTGLNPLRRLRRDGAERVHVPKGLKVRRLHKAFLRYHDPANWPLLREALRRLGRADLIGHRPDQLVPPEGTVRAPAARPQRRSAPSTPGSAGGRSRRTLSFPPAAATLTTEAHDTVTPTTPSAMPSPATAPSPSTTTTALRFVDGVVCVVVGAAGDGIALGVVGGDGVVGLGRQRRRRRRERVRE